MVNDKREDSDDVSVRTEEAPVTTTAERPARHPRVTPLPMNQMLPMTFVLLNESLCATMLLPFVGLLVSHLKQTPVEEAGYESGMLIGVFMLGQMVSAKPWGWMSDNYGRRFPLISGLFTSGLMMLGFGLSSSVWMCAIFRFFHGLFNGNVLVAKTMMADITDNTNQAKGFAFVSLCYGIGVLIGPTLGGLLYDPANSSALRWAHIGEDSVFSRHPAFLPSLVIFIYTNIGMLVCTFFVMESNPKAKPLPKVLKLLYPCFWREPEMFVHPSEVARQKAERATNSTSAAAATSNSSDVDDDDATIHEDDDVMGMSIRTAEGLVANVSMTRAVASLIIASPVRQEDRRFDHLVAAETLTTATPRKTAVTPRYGQSTLPKMLAGGGTATKSSGSDDEQHCVHADASVSSSVRKSSPSTAAVKKAEACVADIRSTPAERTKGGPLSSSGAHNDSDDGLIVVDAERAEAKDSRVTVVAEAEDEETVLKRFGYKQAFQIPVTRTMLVLYMLLSAADMSVQEIIPLWAIAKVSVGGLGFRADKVGYIILTNSVPCVAANLLFHNACTRYDNKLDLFRLSVLLCALSVCVLPFISYFDLGGFVFIAVVLCTSVRQFFASWCYGLVTMLTARSAPTGHVGAIMGINQSCGALTRTLVPFIVTPLFAWSITSDHPFPFDHAFVFLLSGVVFMFTYAWSETMRTDADVHLEMIEELPWWMEKPRQMTTSCFSKCRGSWNNDSDDAPRS